MDGMMCQECGASFQNQNKMRIHIRVSHNKALSTCKICNEVFEGKNKMYNHMRVHQEEPCKFCFKKHPKNAIIDHLKICEDNEEKDGFPVNNALSLAAEKTNFKKRFSPYPIFCAHFRCSHFETKKI